MEHENTRRINQTVESKENALKKLKKEFSRPLPTECIDISLTADIAPPAPSHCFSGPDIINDDELLSFIEEDTTQNLTADRVRGGQLTELGEELKKRLHKETLIDLGCGQQSFVPNLARMLGARRYIGVDINTTEKTDIKKDFSSFVCQDDMLLFTARLPDGFGSFFVAGAEDYSGEIEQVPGLGAEIKPSAYMTRLLEEMYRATKLGGIFISGANNTFPNPRSVGFKKIEFPNMKRADTFVWLKEK